MQNLTKEQLAEINKGIQEVLDKHSITLQVTQGIAYVPLAKEGVVKEVEIISPISNEYNKENI